MGYLRVLGRGGREFSPSKVTGADGIDVARCDGEEPRKEAPLRVGLDKSPLVPQLCEAVGHDVLGVRERAAASQREGVHLPDVRAVDNLELRVVTVLQRLPHGTLWPPAL